MDKEIGALIKTLNGGLQHLPDLAKEMVRQYVVGNAVKGGIELLLAVIILISAILAFRMTFKAIKKDMTKTNEAIDGHLATWDDYFPVYLVGTLILIPLGIAESFLFKNGIADIYHAMTPYMSIVQSLRGY